ncbi:beta-N-acetylhexosaminidase [Paremcibacter congregatus]|uniref:beta-N-acetylhexosaminidase n=1 Tax=Paremcibacter congregatus TaxID=2043170 RepID=A0A2G4YQT1_9PROT|nr:beta-N-acetylhexosaminidase [Paremcibacter congregatus]PHZ84679.1 beta-N-acetylhexosaminidase [Paremcibacter congregatus]QDE28873.1 beta-N-acetylhexosaminidase [Paremcibacter congregatus]
MTETPALRPASTTSNVIFGCSGLRLTRAEINLFTAVKPWGLILFSRNLQSPDQVTSLVGDFKEAIGRDEVMVLIDQEGGRVSRLPREFWRIPPSPTLFAEIYKNAPRDAETAIYLNYRLIAHDLKTLGINVNCAPMLDIPLAGSAPVVTDRALGTTPEGVSQLAVQAIAGMKAGGVAPVIKHGPGHGRATVDSHHDVPRVAASLESLAAFDFIPFKNLHKEAMLMTAHIIYDAIDSTLPGTISPIIINNIIRSELDFGGLIMTDDINMHALSGPIEQRGKQAIAAGCDVILHCSGILEEMTRLAEVVQDLEGASLKRAKKAEFEAFAEAGEIDPVQIQAELDRILHDYL